MQIPKDVKEVIELRSTVWSPCRQVGCTTGSHGSKNDLEEQINHYLQAHDFKLLYIGSETDRNSEGHYIETTVAMIGK